ncbi:MAG: C39 family peptidase [Anaerolineae bacterium]
MQKKLDVPYRSQWAEDAVTHNADCGPTCTAMLLNHYGVAITPDDGYDILSRQFGRHFGSRQYTTTHDLQKICKARDVPVGITWFADKAGAMWQLRNKIDQDKPFIALVNYVPWRSVTGNSFSGSHFVVVVGYDDQHVYMHDPLFGDEQPEEKGAFFKMTTAQFVSGWGGFNNPDYRNNRNGNPDFLLIYPLQAPVIKQPTPVVKEPVATKPIDPTPDFTPPKKDPPSNDVVLPSTDPTDETKRRVEGLAAWHGRSVDWNNGEVVRAWLDHLGSFGAETKRHQVKSGQTLSAISAQYYKRQDKWRTIMAYNRLRFEWANAGQWLRIPLLGDGDGHKGMPNLQQILQAVEAEEFFDPDIEAPAYDELAENSTGMGALEMATVDDSQAAGFSSNPDVVNEDIVTGQNFSATWTFVNSGSTVWDSSYKIVYVNRNHPSTVGAPIAQMSAESAYTITEIGADQMVLPGESMSVTVPLIAPAPSNSLIASHWQLQNGAGENFGALRWITAKIVQGDAPAPVIPDPVTPEPVDPVTPDPVDVGTGTTHTVFMPFVGKDASAGKKTATFGMNINPNLDNTDSREIDYRDIDIEHQKGLGWVRYVYWASRNRRGGKEAYVKRYRELIKTYADAGIKTLFVLHQDTYWGNAPWDHGGWGVYAAAFGRECAEVAAACAEFGDMVAYQIYNETDSGWGDDAANANKSAIGLPPDKYAIILDTAAKAIREIDPNATIVASGMKTGPVNAVNYLKQVQAALKRPLPVDALAYHPYGRRARSEFDFVPFGTLADAFKPFEQAFPNLPIWLTEIGVPGHQHEFPSSRYPEIKTFMDEAIGDFKETHAKQVPVIIWFAWSDFSENSGIVTKDGRFKAGIVEAYQAMRNIS